MSRVYGLFGSGEFLPWATTVDRVLVARAGGPEGIRVGGPDGARVLVVPTASAPEGDTVFARWAEMGIDHYRGMGMAPELAAIRVREDADRPEVAARVAGASLVYFSGGNPAYLARTLKGTAFWAAVAGALDAGCALAGSSAGMSFLGGRTFDPAARVPGGLRVWVDGLGHFPRALLGPHWDAVDRWLPGATGMMLAAVPEGWSFIGVDEDTAVVGDGNHWEVMGRGTATVRRAGEDPVVVASGASFDLALVGDPTGL
ncbi:MAG TPA: Type 1 glutamine amidotransferase-like domain-containing protein [Actinomycetota bacterium]|nr:Type 1 glutamine amidotransferase-like domain-containing protein [Actinomycetota bacterium]